MPAAIGGTLQIGGTLTGLKKMSTNISGPTGGPGGALQRLNAPNKVMEIYKPILLKDLTLSGDVVEENRLGQRSDVLAWFWHIGAPNGGQRDEWMEECESSSTNAPPVDSTKGLKFTG